MGAADGVPLPSDDEQWGMVAAERRELAELATAFTDAQWNTPSLCDGWTVRQVFAHVVLGADPDVRRFLVVLAKSGFNAKRALLRDAIAKGDATSPDELVREMRELATSRKRPVGTSIAGLLAEVIVHGQDIRRPLGVDRVPPVEHTVVALWSMVRTGSILGNKKRIAGLQLVATDVDWSYGNGPEVRGPAEALLMATSGRPIALDDLEGPGADTLRAR